MVRQQVEPGQGTIVREQIGEFFRQMERIKQHGDQGPRCSDLPAHKDHFHST